LHELLFGRLHLAQFLHLGQLELFEKGPTSMSLHHDPKGASTYVASPLFQQLLMRTSFSDFAIFEIVDDIGVLDT
jgi:hypothetical protein